MHHPQRQGQDLRRSRVLRAPRPSEPPYKAIEWEITVLWIWADQGRGWELLVEILILWLIWISHSILVVSKNCKRLQWRFRNIRETLRTISALIRSRKMKKSKTKCNWRISTIKLRKSVCIASITTRELTVGRWWGNSLSSATHWIITWSVWLPTKTAIRCWRRAVPKWSTSYLIPTCTLRWLPGTCMLLANFTLGTARVSMCDQAPQGAWAPCSQSILHLPRRWNALEGR